MDLFQFPRRPASFIFLSVGLITIACAHLVVPPASGQRPPSAQQTTLEQRFERFFSVSSPSPTRQGLFGTAIEKAGDQNGDGVPDVVVGAPLERVGGKPKAGRAYILSGNDGRVLRSLVSPNPSEYGGFGSALSTVGDLDKDGVRDLLVGAPTRSVEGKSQAGKVYVFSGADGSLLRSYSSPNVESNGAFGQSVAGVGDANGDGTPDVLVGAPNETMGEIKRTGRAYLLSGAGDLVLRTFFSPQATEWGSFGGEVAPARDLNGDGTGDLLIGAPSETVEGKKAGRAYVFGGSRGARLDTLVSPNPSQDGRFAAALETVPSSEGPPKVVVGAPGEPPTAEKRSDRTGTGRVYLFQGSDGSLIGDLSSPTPGTGRSGKAETGATGSFGASLSVGPSFGEESGPALVVGSPTAGESDPVGRVHLYNRNGSKHYRSIQAPSSAKGGNFARSVVSFGFSQEQVRLVVGAPWSKANRKKKAGRIHGYQGHLRTMLAEAKPVGTKKSSQTTSSKRADSASRTEESQLPKDESLPQTAPPDTATGNVENTPAQAGGMPAGPKSPSGDSNGRPIDTKIPKTSVKRPDAIAVVVGIKEYKNPDIPDVDFALNDARAIKKYLRRAFGYKEENIIFVENATGTELTRLFGTATNPRGQLYNWVKPGESEVFVYYSGHGAPDPESQKAYLVASDTDPDYLTLNGYPVSQLYENLSKVPARSVTVALEACFSGVSEGGAVVQNVSPAVLSVENPAVGMEKGTVFTAGAADQISTWYNEKQHGLFTYYFLKGLRGRADKDNTRSVTVAEMESYLREKIPYRARRLHNREQTPQVIGQDTDRVLVQYKETKSEQNR